MLKWHIHVLTYVHGNKQILFNSLKIAVYPSISGHTRSSVEVKRDRTRSTGAGRWDLTHRNNVDIDYFRICAKKNDLLLTQM